MAFDEIQFAEAINLRSAGVAIPDDAVIEYSHLARKAELANPATLVIGQVVSLHPTLDWFIHDKRMSIIGATRATTP